MNLIFEIVDFNISYDSVDKVILANPHTFNKIPYSVEKCLSSVASTVNTYTTTSSVPGKLPIYKAKHSIKFLRLQINDHTVLHEVEPTNNSFRNFSVIAPI
jgi:hypothetical protein